MLCVSKRLFDSWNSAGLRYCHWKSNEHLLPGLNGETDLDVLLSKEDRDEGERCLRSLDFLPCQSQFGSRYPDVEDWIGFDDQTGRLIHLHLHYRLATGHKGLKEYSLPWAEEMLQHRILDTETGVYVADPGIELVTLYTRIALKVALKDLGKLRKGCYHVDPSTLKEIAYLKERVDWPAVSDFVARHYGQNGEAVMRIIQAERFDGKAIHRMKQLAERQFRKDNRLGRANRWLEFYYRHAVKFRKTLRNRFHANLVIRKVPKSGRGLQIAFLGQDGAGKTTVTRDIRKWWSWKMDVRYIYLGSGDNYFSWRKVLQKVIPSSAPFKLIRAWLQVSKYKQLAKDVLSMIKSGERFSRKGGLVIYDRYPQVTYPGISDGPKIREKMMAKMPSSIRSLLAGYAKKEERLLKEAASHHPDIVFKLVIPPEESVRRKPENKLETMVRKHELIKSLQFEGSDVHLIDATMPYEKEIVQIKQIIWRHLQK